MEYWAAGLVALTASDLTLLPGFGPGTFGCPYPTFPTGNDLVKKITTRAVQIIVSPMRPGIARAPGTALDSGLIGGHLSNWRAKLKRDRGTENFYNKRGESGVQFLEFE